MISILLGSLDGMNLPPYDGSTTVVPTILG